METLVSHLQGLVESLVPVVVLLGILIFVHELGHFLVAKYFKVRVEVFSLGFGPKLLKFKRGDTVYALSAIPLGGYVKMFGDDPTAEVAADQKGYSFTNKPVGNRIGIVLAGPLMNLFFAAIVFIAVAGVGEQALAPKLGDVERNSPAYAAGFRNGDSIVSVNGVQPKTWDDFQHAIEASADQSMSFVVDRTDMPGQPAHNTTINATPKLAVNKNVLSWDRHVGEIEGLTYSSRSAVIGVRDQNSIAGRAGLHTGDIVQSINGIKISRWSEFLFVLNTLKPEAGGTAVAIKFEVERGLMDVSPEKDIKEKPLDVVSATLNLSDIGTSSGDFAEQILAKSGMEFPELFLATVAKDSPASKAGLLKGDRLIEVGGQKVKNFEQVAGIIREFGHDRSDATKKDATLPMLVEREGKNVSISVAPNMTSRMNAQMREEKHFEIGIRPLVLDAQPATLNLVYSNPIEMASRGLAQTWRWTSLTVLSFVRLFQAEVSPKNIGGLFSIGQMAKRSWLAGLAPFLNMMGIISINLFILNLLPVPVLDGGHLVFYTIEALRGAPLSMRKMELAQQVGLVLLLGLMGFALFNDFTRIFGS